VHVSGVEDQGPQFAQMRDDHRVLVGPNDRLGNVAQIEDLMTDGFDGPISMEAFSPEVHALDDPKSAINESFVHLTEANVDGNICNGSRYRRNFLALR